MEPPALPGVRHDHVSVPGVRVHVAFAGDPDAPPLVLVHGWPQHWWSWRHLIAPLGADHRLIMPDLRGFGWSSVPADGYDKEQLATDLLELLDALGLARVGLVAHDWGAWAGFLAALRAPERFDGFVALGIVPPFHQAPNDAMLDAWRLAYQLVLAAPGVGQALLRSSPQVVARGVRGGATQHDNLGDAACAIYARVLQEPARARASELLYRTFLMREMPGIVQGRYRDARLTVPTVLLNGADDPAIRPRMLRGVDAGDHTLSARTLPDTGHFLPEEQPELVATAVRELLAER